MSDLNVEIGPGLPPVIDFANQRATTSEQRFGGPSPPPIRDAKSEPQRSQETDTVEISFLPPTESGEPEQQAGQVPRLDITV